MGKSSLPPAFRFNPTDVELVQYYLKRKVMGKKLLLKVIAEVDIYKWAPWDLPDKSSWQSGALKWYFFCPTERRYASGARMYRAADCGYWKSTAKDRSVLYSNEVVGWIKTLIFYTGRAPQGERTDWVLHEYRLEDKKLVDMGVPQDSYVLCMVVQKDGIGPRSHKQYGAPFKEEDWTDDEVETDVVPHVNMSEPNLVHANIHEPEPDLIHSNMPEPDLVHSNILEPDIGTSSLDIGTLHLDSVMGKSSWPPGLRFNPTDVELVQYYLKRKVMGKRLHVKVITEVNIYKWAPWDLPDKSCGQSGDLKWYFFCPREKKYPSGARMKRRPTDCGYWMTTGRDRSVLYSAEVVGRVETLVFYTGRAPRGEKTNWVLREYRLEDKKLVDMGVPQDSYVLCMVFQMDGIGPRSNKQYGAPFKGKGWTDDEVDQVNMSEVDQVDMSEVDQVDMSEVDQVNMSEVDQVDMSEPNLVHANIHQPEPDLIHSNMPEPDLVQANIPDQVPVNTNTTESDLVYGNMPDSYRVYPNMPQSDLGYANMSESYVVLPSNSNSSIATRPNSHESCVSDILPPSSNVLQSVSSNYVNMSVPKSEINFSESLVLKESYPNWEEKVVHEEKSEISFSELLELKESYPNLEEKVVHEDEGYDSLPEQLKRLFLYCSLFPSDYEFRRDELVQMWIAEGFIEENHGGVMEDIGGEYFMSLQNKGFLVPSRCDCRLDFDSVFSVPIYNPGHLFYKGNPLKFSRLGSTIAPAEYFVAVDGRLDGALEMTQRLSLICKDIDDMTFGVLKKFKHMRTLLVLAGCGSSIKYVPHDLFFSLKELRTLNLSQTLVSELPSSIRNVKSLRYLDLSNTLITRLPESIDSLHNLQTVRLRGCVHFLQLPKGMKKLINLRHIDLDIMRQLRSMPPHLGSLTNLQTLSAFLVGRDDGCRIGELKNLNDLRGVLRISRLENVSCREEAKAAALSDKIYLQRLELRWSNVFTENTEEQEKILECLQPHAGLKELQIQQYAGSRLPIWISNPCFAELIVLTLYRCKNCKLLPSIGQLPMLKSLSIIEMNEVKEINYQFLGKKNPVDQVSRAFSKLEILEVDIMLNLKVWKDVNIGDLPSLLKLTVDSCPELTTLPSLSWLKSLKHLELRRCPKILTLPSDGLPASLESFIVIDCPELKEWCRMMEGEDWRKLCHLPSIWLDCEEVSKSHSGVDHME